jgi:hypothetical protein
LPVSICETEYRRKRILLSTDRPAVLAVPDRWGQSIDSIADSIRERLTARSYPDRAADETCPLARAALMVPDDLCVLVPSDAGWVLAGACLCSPSYWRLAEKIGRPLVAIHAPVGGLEAAIGERIARFLDNLPVGRTFVRRNWNVHRGTERFHPHPEDWSQRPGVADCGGLFVRSERQTLRKLDAGSLVFTIEVGVYPLAEIAAFPTAASDLLRAIAAMSPEERQSFGYRHHGEALTAWLRGLLASE